MTLHHCSFPTGLPTTLTGLIAAACLAAPLTAQPPNGGFENGDLGGWTAGGGGRVEALQAGGLNPAVVPTEGSWMALLSTGPGNVSGAPSGDFDQNGTADHDATTLSTSITTTAPGETLSFDFAFLTSEVGREDKFDDIFDVTLDGLSILSGSVRKPGGVSPFPDTAPYDGAATTATGSGPTGGSTFSNGRTPFTSFCISITNPGTYTLKFSVADQGNKNFDSGLLIDNVRAPSTCAGAITQVTDTTGSLVVNDDGELEFRIHQNRLVAASDDGAVLAFVSNADPTGDNPNAETQVFVAANGAFERVTAMTGGQAGRPALTSNGRWLAFAATADPAGGNADGNLEIFRFDRQAAAPMLEQVTATTGCSNRQATIAGDSGGGRIAFVTDCPDLAPGFNPDGNSEVVIYDAATSSFVTHETAGCFSRQPAISQHAAGRYVSFVSSCDLTGGNADASLEVFQWDSSLGTFRQVTASASPGAFNDGPTSSFDGTFVAFVSNADHAGANGDGSFEVFRFDRGAGTVQQLTNGFLVFHLAAAIDDSGRWVAVERLDLATFQFDVAFLDAASGVATRVAAGDPSLPAVAVVAGEPRVAFQATTDLIGGNGDGNSEIFTGSSPFGALPLCRAPALAIPDNSPAGVTDTQTVPLVGALADLDVSLEIVHPWVGDLVVTLRHVDTGTTVTLVDRPGRPPGSAGCSGDDLDARLDDEAASPVETECIIPGPISIAGAFTPEQSLAALDGEDLSGNWALTVSDRRGGNVGTLLEWCLIATR